MLGNVRWMSVKGLETGCDGTFFSEFNSEDILGYGGPTRFGFGIPWAAFGCWLWGKSNSMASSVHVGAVFRIGAKWAKGICSVTEGFNIVAESEYGFESGLN